MLIEQVIEFELRGPGPPGHWRSQGPGGLGIPAQEVRSRSVINDKNVAKESIVSSVSVSFSICE